MLKQFLQFKLSQKLSPQQIQLMKLIQLPTQAFEQRIKQELEENPALDNGKEDDNEDEFQNDEYHDSYDDDTINTDDINIDEYLSDDEIIVEDFGIGIGEKELKLITSKFYRVSHNTWNNSLGLG